MSSATERIVDDEYVASEEINRPLPVSKDTPLSTNPPEIPPPKVEAKSNRQDPPPKLNIVKRQQSEATIVTAQPPPADDMDIFHIGGTVTEAFDEHLGEAFAIGKKAYDSQGKLAKGNSQWRNPWFDFWTELLFAV